MRSRAILVTASCCAARCAAATYVDGPPSLVQSLLDRTFSIREHSPWLWVIGKRQLRAFWEKHADAALRLQAWYQVVRAAEWSEWQDVRRTFPSADMVGRLVVFNVGGNSYRVIARVEFKLHKVFIRRVLTHAEYSTNEWKHDPWL